MLPPRIGVTEDFSLRFRNMKIYQLVYHVITDILQGVVMKYYYIECRGYPIIDELPTLNDGIDAVLY